MRENAWKKYDEKEMSEVFAFSEGYKKFISDCKTERECVDAVSYTHLDVYKRQMI